VPLQRPASVAVEPVHVAIWHAVPLACRRHFPAPSQEPSVPQLAAPMSAHWLSGSDPRAMNVHVPTDPVRLQAWQRLEQPVAQQTPCSQKFDAQSAAAVHGAPADSLAQIVPLQTLPGEQSALVAHFVRQVPAVPHRYGKQFCRPGERQAPAALHWPGKVSVEPAQVAAMHRVPTAYLRQPPAPSQVPSVPHAPGPPSAHWPSGSLPAGTLVQVPRLPGTAQDRQLPVHMVAQQTPCWQNPALQSASLPQVPPGGARPQLLFVHTLPGLQSALVLQVVRHWPVVPHI
jgi:hypothetical protein